MNRLQQRLQQRRQAGRKLLVTYIVAGAPECSVTLEAMKTLVQGGSDVIELGVPFSDPFAEGEVIQRAHECALAQKTSLKRVLQLVETFRQSDHQTPVVLMGYANPIERVGAVAFSEAASAAGVDALLTVDLPPEEAETLNLQLQKNGLLNLLLLAPTSSDARIKYICQQASGFIYYVSLRGVTGGSHIDIAEVGERVALIREQTQLPICVGFGIGDAASAQALCRYADGVVVGTVLVRLMQTASGASMLSQLHRLVAELRAAIDAIDA